MYIQFSSFVANFTETKKICKHLYLRMSVYAFYKIFEVYYNNIISVLFSAISSDNEEANICSCEKNYIFNHA